MSVSLIILALVYGFLAAFHSILDLDLGFHLAIARYVLVHHTIPTNDVLSYTERGAEWRYPPFGGLLL